MLCYPTTPLPPAPVQLSPLRIKHDGTPQPCPPGGGPAGPVGRPGAGATAVGWLATARPGLRPCMRACRVGHRQRPVPVHSLETNGHMTCTVANGWHLLARGAVKCVRGAGGYGRGGGGVEGRGEGGRVPRAGVAGEREGGRGGGRWDVYLVYPVRERAVTPYGRGPERGKGEGGAGAIRGQGLPLGSAASHRLGQPADYC